MSLNGLEHECHDVRSVACPGGAAAVGGAAVTAAAGSATGAVWSDAELESRRAALLAQLHEHEAD